MSIDEKNKQNEGASSTHNINYKEYLYFAYKKAKHYVTKEISFVEHTEILLFEQELDENIEELAKLLRDSEYSFVESSKSLTPLSEKVNKMQGELFFTPKSFGSKNEPRIRPKVAFPFEYQILWATVILIVGEWFDTNTNVKNTYSMCNQSIRKQFDWMVPWSYNGRIKRIQNESSEDEFSMGYIHYNSSQLYESHQMALRKVENHRIQISKEKFIGHKDIYYGELDIKEFFPTLKMEKIIKALEVRFNELNQIEGFDRYFNPCYMLGVMKELLEINIVYPDCDIYSEQDSFGKMLKSYYEEIVPKSEIKEGEEIKSLIKFLNKTLPLDLIASSFLSNCSLNHFVDKEIEEHFKQAYVDDRYSILRYTDDYMIYSSDKELVREIVVFIKEKLNCLGLNESVEKTLPTSIEDVKEKIRGKMEDNSKENTPSFIKEYIEKIWT